MSHRLDVSVKRIVQQSKRTAAELQLHVDESTLLQTENKALQEERKSLTQVCICSCLPYCAMIKPGRPPPAGDMTHDDFVVA